MCLYGVTGRSGHVDRTHRSVYPELQCLQCDRTRPIVIFPLWNLLESTGRWPSASGHLTSQHPVAPDENTLVK